MQTFLPLADFKQSARCLDRQRLGKQRVEVLQILKALTDPAYGWQKHPAIRMWRGYEKALVHYGWAICGEWQDRGYQDTCYNKITEIWRTLPGPDIYPHWLGDEAFHASHRAALLAKLPGWYGQFGWAEAAGVGYIWPARE